MNWVGGSEAGAPRKGWGGWSRNALGPSADVAHWIGAVEDMWLAGDVRESKILALRALYYPSNPTLPKAKVPNPFKAQHAPALVQAL